LSSSTASKLDGLLGLGSAKAVVRRLASRDSGIHAILLYGSKGSGKSELANLIAEFWLCTQPTEEGADGACRACAAFGRGNSADLLIVSPSGPSAIIRNSAIVNDKPANDEPIPILTFFRTSPMLSRHKVAVIHDAHRMNSSAANALLKTLEEPHPHAKMILTTDSVGSILPTILSRCLAVACEAPTRQELSERFPDASPDQVRFAEGTPGRLQTVEARKQIYERIAAFGRGLAKRHPGEALVAAEELLAISDSLQSAMDGSARAAHTELLDALAIFFAREPGAPPQWPQLIAEAHRRIVGNGGASVVFDALLAAMLLGSR
jgi:hypothetical protein